MHCNLILFLFLILISFSYADTKDKKEKEDRGFDYFEPPIQDNLEEQKEKLEKDYQNKLKENNFLKNEIEKNLKYIKILLASGIIMFSFIIYISIKIYIKGKKRKQESKANNDKFNDNISINENSQEKVVSNPSSINFSIDKSNYNLLHSDKNVVIPNNNIENSEINNNNSFDNNNIQEENNYDAPKIANFSNVEINDDNKTLTNNPDLFVPSRMDRILYKPYLEEEIK